MIHIDLSKNRGYFEALFDLAIVVLIRQWIRGFVAEELK